MRLKNKRIDSTIVVQIQDKRLDVNSSKDFEDKMSKLINGDVTKVGLDLSQVEFVDSSGLASIISTLKKIGSREKLVVFGAEGHVKGLFQLTKMDQVFNMAVTEEEALALLGTK